MSLKIEKKRKQDQSGNTWDLKGNVPKYSSQ